MGTKNTIVINGKVYDAISGLPAAAPDSVYRSTQVAAAKPVAHATAPVKPMSDVATHHQASKAKAVHRQTQRSQTLRRDILKAPKSTAPVTTHHIRTAGSVHKSPMISKFAPHPQPLHVAPVEHKATAAPAVHHPAHTPAVTHSPKPVALSSRELKEKLIAERLASVQTDHSAREHKAPKRSFFARAPRASSILVACFAIVFLGGYLTYINMPNVSMRVAAARAGVDASFPDYHPDGYRFDGPIAYNNGEVDVKFASNTNSSSDYTIQQKNSNWDSQAVLDNYVSKKTDNYLTYSEKGLTIYTFDGKAAWVNGGVFYSIDGNAPLSSDQILRIAGSM